MLELTDALTLTSMLIGRNRELTEGQGGRERMLFFYGN